MATTSTAASSHHQGSSSSRSTSSSSSAESSSHHNRGSSSRLLVITNTVLCLSLLLNFSLSNKIFFSSSNLWPSILTSDAPDAPDDGDGGGGTGMNDTRLGRDFMTTINPNLLSNASLQDLLTVTAGAPTLAKSQLTAAVPPTTVSIMFGMAGATDTFIDEWEVALKSILLNAPVDAALHLHIVANLVAKNAVESRILNAGIIGTHWRNPITITVYDVEDKTAEWREFIMQKIRGHRMDRRVTLGGYYRLLAYKVIPPETGPVLYMDTDAVIITNLNDLWKLVDPRKVIQLSLEWICSGFMIINIDKFDQFWKGIDDLPNITHGGDQTLVTEFAKTYPNQTANLPRSWDANLGNGWKHKSQLFLQRRQEGAGFLHFNGVRPKHLTYFTNGFMQYCMNGCPHTEIGKRDFQNSWGLADYYVRVTWPWVKYFGASTIAFGHEGYPLRYRLVVDGNTTEPYSVQSSPQEGTVELTTKKVPVLSGQFEYEENVPIKLRGE